MSENGLRKGLKIEDILEATGGKIISANSPFFTGVSIDSRTIKEGELFVALRGNKFNGHDFLQEALTKGDGAIVSQSPTNHRGKKTVILVEDTLRALQNLATYMRFRKNIPVIGITGSNGKTTTKELVALVLRSNYKVLKNPGNLNNHIGLPLTLTKVQEDDEVVVLEMGASGPGEIKELCDIAKPDYGILTNLSPSHLEGFRDMDTLRKTKLEILEGIKVAIVNADDTFLMDGIQSSGFKGKIVRFGISNMAELYATNIKLKKNGSIFLLHIDSDSIEVCSKISGKFNIYNLLASAAIGSIFNIKIENIKSALESFKGVPMRFEVKEDKGIQIISDVYNANPASMEEAIKELVRLKKGRAIAVLGDMLELGSYEKDAHKRLVMWMSELPVDIFIAVGPIMSSVASEFKGEVYKSRDSFEAKKILRDICIEGDTVLIKGSRGMSMEKVLETLYAI
ncbi:MAG: UDP-N-acetylmuramoyl-tripeptide--D-alanyl-D-alanine ligase [Nitrospirae bacterium]|nr:UDP-N-acetylmuramoyl-tripeptide--D-alanyl-D-alanine ligase [Nitrospirota bacterium]